MLWCGCGRRAWGVWCECRVWYGGSGRGVWCVSRAWGCVVWKQRKCSSHSILPYPMEFGPEKAFWLKTKKAKRSVISNPKMTRGLLFSLLRGDSLKIPFWKLHTETGVRCGSRARAWRFRTSTKTRTNGLRPRPSPQSLLPPFHAAHVTEPSATAFPQPQPTAAEAGPAPGAPSDWPGQTQLAARAAELDERERLVKQQELQVKALQEEVEAQNTGLSQREKELTAQCEARQLELESLTEECLQRKKALEEREREVRIQQNEAVEKLQELEKRESLIQQRCALRQGRAGLGGRVHLEPDAPFWTGCSRSADAGYVLCHAPIMALGTSLDASYDELISERAGAGWTGWVWGGGLEIILKPSARGAVGVQESSGCWSGAGGVQVCKIMSMKEALRVSVRTAECVCVCMVVGNGKNFAGRRCG